LDSWALTWEGQAVGVDTTIRRRAIVHGFQVRETSLW
jgi:hypothetical protein